MAGSRVLLIDPSDKGALPLYTAMVASGLASVAMQPAVLGSRRLVEPEIPSASWPVLRRLPAERWPRPPGAPPVPAWRQALAWLGCAIACVFAALRQRPRIIHVQHPIHPRLDHMLVRILKRVAPVVWTAHDVLPHDASRNAAARAKQIYSLASLVLVHSEPAAEEVARLAGVRATVIRHPVLRLDDPPSRAAARRRLGLPEHGRIALAAGFIRTYKGYDLLADTWDHLGDETPLLLVLGELVDAGEAATMARLKAHPRTDVRLGYASDDDIVAGFAAADIALLPHLRGSDSGSLHVARAVGTPVLSSDSPQLAAVVTATSAGRVLARDHRLWAAALIGSLPAPPPPPPRPEDTGAEHAAAYLAAEDAWCRPRRMAR